MLNKFISLTDQQSDLLGQFYDIHMGATLNLTSIKDRDEFYLKHYLDSLFIFQNREFKFDTLLDVGSGGGFPGVPLAILYPSKKIYLCESIRKKCDFLNDGIGFLGLKNVEVLNCRVEDIKNKKFDMITARGVSRVLQMLKFLKNVSRETTTLLFYKGEKLEEELKEANEYIKNKKLRVENVRIETPFQRTYSIIDLNPAGLRK